jgi:hypothetical protein
VQEEIAQLTMSTPAGTGTAEAKNMDRRMSLGKYVKRMSSVFKREKSGKTSDLAAPVSPSVDDAQEQSVLEESTEVKAASAA